MNAATRTRDINSERRQNKLYSVATIQEQMKFAVMYGRKKRGSSYRIHETFSSQVYHRGDAVVRKHSRHKTICKYSGSNGYTQTEENKFLYQIAAHFQTKKDTLLVIWTFCFRLIHLQKRLSKHSLEEEF